MGNGLGREESYTDDGQLTLRLEDYLFLLLYPFDALGTSDQRVPEPDPLPGISFDTRPDPIQF